MVTGHAIQRIRERTGLNPRSAARLIERALERGKGTETLNGKDREYLLQKEEKKGCRALAYNMLCFIVSEEDTCITAYWLPPQFGKKKHYDGKREIRDVKRYARFQDSCGEEDVN